MGRVPGNPMKSFSGNVLADRVVRFDVPSCFSVFLAAGYALIDDNLAGAGSGHVANFERRRCAG